MKTGDVAWDRAIADAAAGYSITGGPRAGNGKVTIGTTGAQANTFPALVPEIRNPPDRGAAVFVFELPPRS